MKNTIARSLLLLFLVPFPTFSHAADVPKTPDKVDVMGRTLQLNGEGLRTATIFKVKVYKAGLYLTQRSKDAEAILNSPEPKVIRLTFVRDVKPKQVQDAWTESFKKNCDPDCDKLQTSFNHFVTRMPGAQAGDVFVYVFTPQGLGIIRNGKEIERIGNSLLAKLVLSTWIGKEPPSTDLKQALLGQARDKDLSS